MNTRQTSDYGDLHPSTQAYQDAVRARKEMMSIFARANVEPIVRRKGWQKRMHENAKGFGSEVNIKRHREANAARAKAAKAAKRKAA